VLTAVGVLFAVVTFAIVTPGIATAALSPNGASPVVTYPLKADTYVSSEDHEKQLISADLTLSAGESRRIVAQANAILAISGGRPSIDFTVGINCAAVAGTQPMESSYAQTSLIVGKPDTLRPSLLLTALAAGQYRCQLVGSTTQTADGLGQASMAVLNTSTYLMVSAGNEVGSQRWQNPDCDPSGTYPSCRYIGILGVPEINVFYNDGTPLKRWTAATSAANASMAANVELTTCGHTASCGTLQPYDFDHSTVTSYLEAVQVNEQGLFCNATQTTPQTDVIGVIPHHYNIAYLLPSVPVLTTCGSRDFYIFVHVGWDYGNPVKIDGSTGPHQSQTNAFAINGTSSLPPVVVNPVANVTVPYGQYFFRQLTAPTSTYPYSWSAVGLPGGVTLDPNGVLSGTPVQQGTFTVTYTIADTQGNSSISTFSLGAYMAQVPDLVGQPKISASSILSSAGLTLGATTKTQDDRLCNRVGDVASQFPAAGTLVQPGSTVSITYYVQPTAGCF
jgi:hypothetical protein